MLHCSGSVGVFDVTDVKSKYPSIAHVQFAEGIIIVVANFHFRRAANLDDTRKVSQDVWKQCDRP